jgi:hypothetical protein
MVLSICVLEAKLAAGRFTNQYTNKTENEPWKNRVDIIEE